MRTGTVVSLGASAVLGLGALIVARVWLPQSAKPQGPAAPVATDTAPVVVATGDIPYGTKLDPSKLVVVRLPVADVPKGAYATTAQVLDQTGGAPIALTPIAQHEAILPDKLSGAGARATVAAAISEGMRAYTIGISDVAGVGGHALPGDRVDVVLTRQVNAVISKDGKAAAPLEDKPYVSDVVLQDVKVLGMDLNADPTSTQAAVAHTATLEVTVQDAQKLAVAGQAGSLSLALRRTGNAEVDPVHTVAVSDVIGFRPASPRLIQVAHRKPAALPSPMLVKTHSVVVVHGDASSSVEVPAERFGAGA